MKFLTTLFSGTVLVSAMAISLTTQAAEVMIEPITAFEVNKNIEIVNLDMTTQINQDIKTSLSVMLMPKVNEAAVLLAKSTSETTTSADIEAVE